MSDQDRRERVRATGELLHTLLYQRNAYRARWRQFTRKESASAVHQASVAQVIALHLWERGERAENQLALPRILKDRIHRALAGESLSAETLTWFIEAFDMSTTDSARLRGLRFSGATQSAGPVVDTLRRPLLVPVPQQHRTLSVFERRTVSADRRPLAHHTTRAILACEDGVVTFHYRVIPQPLDVVVLRGGQVAAQREFTGSTPVFEITLARPLAAGQVASLDYEVTFPVGSASTTEYRRVASGRTENVDIAVVFDPGHQPRSVWWTHWDDYQAGQIVHEERATLDAETTAHRFVPYLENAAAGFRWT
ncbi:MAG: hypothetical protein ABW215_13395, partial [Kibdelosporangium sp.]